MIDYGFHMTITDLASAPEEAMDEMVSAGVTTFKLLMAYPGTFMVNDETIYRVLRRSARLGGLVMVHAENGIAIDFIVREAVAAGHIAPIYHAHSRPAILEGEAAERAITLATLTDAPLYVVHVSCAHSLHAVAAARAKDYQSGARRVHNISTWMTVVILLLVLKAQNTFVLRLCVVILTTRHSGLAYSAENYRWFLQIMPLSIIMGKKNLVCMISQRYPMVCQEWSIE